MSLVDSDLVGYLATFDFENTLKGWIKLYLFGYLATIKFRRHILSLVDSDLVGYLATLKKGEDVRLDRPRCA